MIVYDVVVEDEMAGWNGRVTQFYDNIIMKTRPLSCVVHCCNAFYRLSFSSIYLRRQEYPHLSKLNNHVIYEAGIDYLPRTYHALPHRPLLCFGANSSKYYITMGGSIFTCPRLCKNIFVSIWCSTWFRTGVSWWKPNWLVLVGCTQ